MTDSLVHSLEHQTPVLSAENPWPGLAPFSEEHTAYFHGRGREVETLFRLVRLNVLAVLYGQSGLGKTSLLQAALFPRLRAAGLLPVSIRLDYSRTAPPARTQIWQALEAALRAAGATSQPLGEDETLWELFHRRSLKLAAPDGRALTPVLVFDQFEELFTLGAERSDERGLVRDLIVELAALIENHPPDRVEGRFDREPKLIAGYDFDRQDFRILLSLREDYLAHLHELSARIPSITLNNMRLAPLDGTRALEAVEKPGGRLVAPGAAEAIVRFVAGAREERRRTADLVDPISEEHRAAATPAPIDTLVVDPSLLSLFCRELNQKRREERLPAITAELVAANREDILAEFYARCLSQLPSGVQIFVEEDLLTESGFRETLTVENAEAKLSRHGGSPEALKTLVNRRLLHYEQRGPMTRVELTHDVLAPVARHSRSLRREREAIEATQARQRRALEENERLAKEARAKAEAKYERSRRQRRLVVLFGLGMAAVAAVAVYQRKEARSQRDRAQNLLATLETTNSHLIEQQQALADTTKVAKMARDSAHQALADVVRARAASDSMLADFCTYGLKVINRFGDSTSNNTGLRKAFNSLVELSDTSVDQMVKRNPKQLCPKQLDARVTSISANLLYELGDTAGSIERGRHGLAAARLLKPFSDSVSRWVATRSFSDLASTFFFDHAYPDALAAAQEAIPLARAVDRRRDSTALDRLARVYHYGALALLRSGRGQEAERWVAAGFAVVDSGTWRQDQKQAGLLFTKSQLWLRQSEADSTQHRPTETLVDMRRAVEAARLRYDSAQYAGNRKWLAQMHGWHAVMARRLGRHEEATVAYDSSVANWHWLVEYGHRRADTVWIAEGLQAIGEQLIGQAHSWLVLNRSANAVAGARAAKDSLDALVHLQAAFPNQHAQAAIYDSAGAIFDRAGQRANADAAYRREYVIDSTIAYLPTTGAEEMLTFYGTLGRLAASIDFQVRTDTAGQDSTAKAAAMFRLATAERRYREQQVTVAQWLHTDARRRARSLADSQRVRRNEGRQLAQALGNLSWNELETGRAELALSNARKAESLAPDQTYILVNLFNALVISGFREEAERFFRSHATQMVESTPILFPCAVERDMAELLQRGTALPTQAGVLTGLVAPYRTKCPPPKPSATP